MESLKSKPAASKPTSLKGSTFACQFCSVSLASSSRLSNHIGENHRDQALGENWQTCPQCQTVCPSRHLLIRHMIEIHTLQKKYQDESTIKEPATGNNRLPEKSLDLKPGTSEPENAVKDLSGLIRNFMADQDSVTLNSEPVVDKSTATQCGQLETVAEIRNFMAYQDSVTLNSGLATDVTVSAAAGTDSNSKPATSSILPCAYSGPEDHSKQDPDPIRLCLSLDRIRKTWSISESESSEKVLSQTRLDFGNDGTVTSEEASDEEIDQVEYQTRIRTLKKNIYQTVCRIKKIECALIASGQQETVSSGSNQKTDNIPGSYLDIKDIPNPAAMPSQHNLPSDIPMKQEPDLTTSTVMTSSTGSTTPTKNIIPDLSKKDKLENLHNYTNVNSNKRNLQPPNLISKQETKSFAVLPAKKKIILQPSFKRESPVSSLKAGLPNDAAVNSTLPLAHKRKFLNSAQTPDAKRKFLDKKLSAVKPSSLSSSAPNSKDTKIQVVNSSKVQELRVASKFQSNNTMDTQRRFLDTELSAVKTSLTPDAEDDDIQMLHSSFFQEVHAVTNFQNNNTKGKFSVREIPAFKSPTCQIKSIQQANLLESSKYSDGFQVKELTTDGNSREFFNVGPTQNLIIEEDEIDLKKNPEYFPFEGPYMCEICRMILSTNREFVHHIRTEHPNEIDSDVVQIMEAHVQISTSWF